MPVAIDNSPNKYLMLSQVLGNYFNQRQDSNEADDKIDALKQAQRQQLVQKLIEAQKGADPTTTQWLNDFMAKNPDIFSGINFPTKAPSPEQTYADAAAKAKQSDLTSGAQPSILPGNDAGNFSPSAALMGDPTGRGTVLQPMDRLNAWQRNYRATYNTDPPEDIRKQAATFFLQGTPGQTSANQIDNKQTMGAKDQDSSDLAWDKRDSIDKPESTSKISLNASIRAKNYADANKKNSDAQPSSGDKSIVDQVYKNPQAYFSLTKDQKDAYTAAGGQPVVRLNADLTKRQFGAQAGLALIGDVQGIVDKWHQRGVEITGPLVGRYNEATNSWGGNILPTNLPQQQSNEYQADISKLQEWLSAGKLQEAAALVGSRPAFQTINMLATPGIKSNNVRIDGSLAGMKTRLQQIDDQINAAQWGGKDNIPQGSRGGQYDAKTEAGITNVMNQLQMTREQAVMELRKRGAVQ